MHLYIATTNPGKLRDFHYIAAQQSPSPGSSPLIVAPLPNLAAIPAPEENGDTFEANARLKAIFYSQHAPNQWVLADDSGLEVDALEGRPGVRSARFAQDLGALNPSETPDESNNNALLLAMLEQTVRSACYRCALALARNGTVHQVAYGTLEGEVLSNPEGTGGFGYDPLFFLPELSRTMAQLTSTERLQYSHRVRALRDLFAIWP